MKRNLKSDRRHIECLKWAEYGNRIHVHFAMVDCRIAAWLNGKLAHEWYLDEENVDVEPPTPIQIIAGVEGVKISNLRIYRDIYYTQQVGATDFLATDAGREMMGDAKEFNRFREARQRTTEFTVPAGSYFVLGDNSIRSHDGRHWKHSHFVDERMIVGRVLFKLGR